MHNPLAGANTQAEESYFSAEDFCRAVKKESSVVLQTEVAFLQVQPITYVSQIAAA